MFGGNKKPPAPVGATEKLAAAQKMKQMGRFEMAELSRGGGGERPVKSQTVPIAIIYGLCTAVALIFTDGSSTLSTFHPTGVPSLDGVLTGASMHSFMGDPDMDRVITIFIRGFALFVASGFIPLFGWLALRMFGRDKLHALTAAWGALIFVPVVFYFGKDYVTDLLSAVMGLI